MENALERTAPSLQRSEACQPISAFRTFVASTACVTVRPVIRTNRSRPTKIAHSNKNGSQAYVHMEMMKSAVNRYSLTSFESISINSNLQQSTTRTYSDRVNSRSQNMIASATAIISDNEKRSLCYALIINLLHKHRTTSANWMPY